MTPNPVLARVRVFLKSAPTYLVAAGAVVTVLADELGKVFPNGWQDNATQIAGTLLGIIGAAVAIIRRVTPVLPEERGMLAPPKPPNPLDPATDELPPARPASPFDPVR